MAQRRVLLLLLALVAAYHGGGAPRAHAAGWLGGLSRASFPEGFVFGTATSAYQVEGMADGGGRGPSTWDAFAQTPGNIVGNATADVTTDQYHHYKEDINLMKGLNFDAYRFSISWSRIFPDGEGKVNEEGVAYYNILIDYLLQKGITPYANLYHSDLPLALEKKFGGWLSSKTGIYCTTDDGAGGSCSNTALLRSSVSTCWRCSVGHGGRGHVSCLHVAMFIGGIRDVFKCVFSCGLTAPIAQVGGSSTTTATGHP